METGGVKAHLSITAPSRQTAGHVISHPTWDQTSPTARGVTQPAAPSRPSPLLQGRSQRGGGSEAGLSAGRAFSFIFGVTGRGVVRGILLSVEDLVVLNTPASSPFKASHHFRVTSPDCGRIGGPWSGCLGLNPTSATGRCVVGGRLVDRSVPQFTPCNLCNRTPVPTRRGCREDAWHQGPRTGQLLSRGSDPFRSRVGSVCLGVNGPFFSC